MFEINKLEKLKEKRKTPNIRGLSFSLRLAALWPHYMVWYTVLVLVGAGKYGERKVWGGATKRRKQKKGKRKQKKLTIKSFFYFRLLGPAGGRTQDLHVASTRTFSIRTLFEV